MDAAKGYGWGIRASRPCYVNFLAFWFFHLCRTLCVVCWHKLDKDRHQGKYAVWVIKRAICDAGLARLFLVNALLYKRESKLRLLAPAPIMLNTALCFMPWSNLDFVACLHSQSPSPTARLQVERAAHGWKHAACPWGVQCVTQPDQCHPTLLGMPQQLESDKFGWE